MLSFVMTLFAMLALMTPFALISNSYGLAMILAVLVGSGLLFLLGLIVGRLCGRHPLRYGLVYVVLGLAGAGLSFVVGDVVRILISG